MARIIYGLSTAVLLTLALMRLLMTTPVQAQEGGTVPPIGACGTTATLIHAIQGSGDASAQQGEVHTVEGIVVGDFQSGSTGLGGFFLQEEAAQADGDPTTSEGLFVYDDGNGVPVDAGDIVRVQGTVEERFGLTRLADVVTATLCSGGSLPTPITLTLPVSTSALFEYHEGMLVGFSQELYVTENYNLGRFGEIEVSSDGRLYQPTNEVEPGAAANALQEENNERRIQIDDGSNRQNPMPLPPYFAADGTLRAGDVTTSVVGALGYAFGTYEIHPTEPVSFTRRNERPATPADTGGRLTVASFNVLNYFTTIDDGPDVCGPSGDMDCRGADSQQEFERQRAKILAALEAMDADVVGLVELENNAQASLQDLVDGLNDALGTGTYDFVDTGTIGTDAIKVGLIYKPATIMPTGTYTVLTSAIDSRFIDTLNRPALAQTFAETATGERVTVAVNHLKSKGSDCDDVGDPDVGDGQGNCNQTRTQAARALVDWLDTNPTGSGDGDYLIVGDLNAYAMEDPIDAVRAGPDDAIGTGAAAGTGDDYTDLINLFVDQREGEEAYSYVFGGQAGYLDHALATSSLTDQVAGVTVWHINADEPRALDYNDFNQDQLYSDDPYRSSDHDPVIVGLNLMSDFDVFLPLIFNGAAPE